MRFPLGLLFLQGASSGKSLVPSDPEDVETFESEIFPGEDASSRTNFPQGLTGMHHEYAGAAGLADLNPRLFWFGSPVVKIEGPSWTPYRHRPAKSAYASGNSACVACSVARGVLWSLAPSFCVWVTSCWAAVVGAISTRVSR